MDDIAKHLGMSKKTIYQFFSDKGDVVKSLLEKELVCNECEFKDIAGKSSNSIEEILQMMKHMQLMFSKMNPNLFYDLQKYHPESWQLFRSFKEKFIMEQVERNLIRGIEEGFYRKDINIKVIAKLRIEEVELAMSPHAFPPDKFQIADVQTSLLDHFLHGIVTIKGHKLINKYKQLNEDE